MAEQSSAQPEQPEKVPPGKAEPAAPSPELARGGSPQKAIPTPPGENADRSLQDSSAERPADSPQGAELPAEASENFPFPLDADIGYEIVEPPEGEESDDGFASIPPGPTEEVNFAPPRVRGPRRRRGRREAVRAGTPEPEMEAAIGRFPIWLAVAGALLLVAIAIVIVLLIVHGRRM
jgi:hypothetical protein